MRSGDCIEIEITDLAHDGCGVGRFDNFVVFVRKALIGDKVICRVKKVKKTYAKAELCEVKVPSSDRIVSDCEYFGSCGGCDLRNYSYLKELEHKTRRVKKAISKIAKCEPDMVEDCIGCLAENAYRNKVEVAVSLCEGKLHMGFMSKESYDIVDVKECKLLRSGMASALSAIRELLLHDTRLANDIAQGGMGLHHIILRESVKTNEVMVVLVSSSYNDVVFEEFISKLVKTDKNIVSVHQVTGLKEDGWNFFGGTNLLFGQEKLFDSIGHLEIEISAASFMQINNEQAALLYDKALEYASLKKEHRLLDLYCGAGSLGLYMSKECGSVLGVEIVESAVNDAFSNKERNGISNASFMLSASEKAFFDIKERDFMPDVVVLDPPRSGCDASVIINVAKLLPKRVVYVSCDPETMARDIKLFLDEGYQLEKVQPLDMFPRTSHVETVVLLSKRVPQSHILVDIEFGEGEGKLSIDKI